MTQLPRARRRKTTQQRRQIGLSLESLETRVLLAADVVGLSPEDNSTDVPVDVVLETSWSDPIRVGPGAGNIYLHNADDNSLIEAINVRSDNVQIDGSNVTISPSNSLPPNTNVSVRVDVAKYRDLGTEVTTQTIFSENFESVALTNSPLDAPFDEYVVLISGVLDVQVAGDYTFGGHTEDGSFLAIDVDQDGFDLFDDLIYEDDSTHGDDDRLHTCGEIFENDVNEIESCVGSGGLSGDGQDAINLQVGEYEFTFGFFNASGSGSGEFFYAAGYHEIFDANEFALVGDDSKGIGITADGLTLTTYKEIGANEINSTQTAFAVIEDDATLIGTATATMADVAELSTDGRFQQDNAIPGQQEWIADNDPSFENWSDEAPFGWVRDNSFLDENRPNGPQEYNGWTFLNKDFWITEQGDQARTVYENGQGTVAVVDPDAFDDFLGINSDTGDNANECEPLPLEERTAGGECGYFTSGLSTPPIYLDGVAENSATLKFDSSWRDETTQSAETTVEYFDGEGNSIGKNVLLRWESIQGENYKPREDADGNDDVNEEVVVDLNNPAEAASLVVTFSMPYAQNDWWWAVDNIEVTADVEGAVSAGIRDDTTWNFTTADVVLGPEIDLSTGTAAQSSQLGGFVAENALDDVVNFTHTEAGDENPTWQVLLPQSHAFDAVTVFNRGASEGTLSCCPSRLRDITIQIVDFEGDATTDFTGGEVVYSSALLNPENVLGGGTNTSGPISLAARPGGAVGNLIRVIRTPDDDLSGTGGQGNNDEGSVLSIDLVVANGTPTSTSLVGDIDNDGTVGFSDFLILSANFGTSVPANTGGDLDGDGNVAFADFLLLSNNFGQSAAAVDAALADDDLL